MSLNFTFYSSKHCIFVFISCNEAIAVLVIETKPFLCISENIPAHRYKVDNEELLKQANENIPQLLRKDNSILGGGGVAGLNKMHYGYFKDVLVVHFN